MANVECARCDFTGSEDEFLAAGLDDSGREYFVRRECAPSFSVMVCVGCVAAMGHTDREVVRRALLHLLASGMFV